MTLRWHRADQRDVDILTETRVRVLLAANGLTEDTDMTRIAEASREAYLRDLGRCHTAYLVYDGEMVVGTGGISYYTVLPTIHNPTGRKAYVMNMYTAPAYRRQGIAAETLRLLVEDAHSRGVRQICLEATEMGRPLYERFGFRQAQGEMELLE